MRVLLTIDDGGDRVVLSHKELDANRIWVRHVSPTDPGDVKEDTYTVEECVRRMKAGIYFDVPENVAEYRKQSIREAGDLFRQYGASFGHRVIYSVPSEWLEKLQERLTVKAKSD